MFLAVYIIFVLVKERIKRILETKRIGRERGREITTTEEERERER